jgi:hypothetical protein
VTIGEQTRLADKLLPAHTVTKSAFNLPFIIHQQGVPQKSSSQIQFNHFISTSGDKLEACLKVIECPPDTVTAMVRDGYTMTTVAEFLTQADLIIASVPLCDQSDFADTRLHAILEKHAKNVLFLDWQH